MPRKERGENPQPLGELNKTEKENAAVQAWIERELNESPPLSDEQLRSVGEILGIRLIRRSSKLA